MEPPGGTKSWALNAGFKCGWGTFSPPLCFLAKVVKEKYTFVKESLVCLILSPILVSLGHMCPCVCQEVERQTGMACPLQVQGAFIRAQRISQHD